MYASISKFLLQSFAIIAVFMTSQAAFAEKSSADEQVEANIVHEAVFTEDRFPSAQKCRVCHEDHYREWSVSPHAYAQVSPIFNAMQGAVNVFNNGTNGDFCIRCHTPVGMAIGESTFMSNLDRDPVSREGITCIACHRVNKDYGKFSSRYDLAEGDIFAAVTGPTGNAELKKALDDPQYKVVTEKGKRGRQIHTDIETFFHLSQPQFCGQCHDVNLPTGFRLEEAFSEYKASPAAERGETCQDCHMGIVPGKVSGYKNGPAAIVGGKETPSRKLTNHMFIGPDYSIIHPGIFPHNPDAEDMASLEEWLQFDWEAGWGTDAFEDSLAENVVFPARWSSVDDRYDAREIINAQLELLDTANDDRIQLLRNGFRTTKVSVDKVDEEEGMDFRVQVFNPTDGHNVPTGFTGERLYYMEVTVRDAEDNIVFQSGNLDPNGDVLNSHSVYVHDGFIEQDLQLFSLQAGFLTRNRRGSERDAVLPINFSLDPLPFLRPSRTPAILDARPGDNRLHKPTLTPLEKRWVPYHVDAELLTGKAPYNLTVRLFAQMVPVNLVVAIQDVGFDYNMSTQEVIDRLVAGKVMLEESRIDMATLGVTEQNHAYLAEYEGKAQATELVSAK